MKKYFKIALIIVILVAILIFSYNFDKKSIRSINETEKELVQERENELDKIQIKECAQKEDFLERDLCYYDLAIENLDDSFCDEIIENHINDSAVNSEGLKEDFCYIDVSIEKPEDLTICNKIQNGEDRDFCYRRVAVAKKELSICDMMGPGLIWHCYSDVAFAKGDSLICNNILDENWKNICQIKLG